MPRRSAPLFKAACMLALAGSGPAWAQVDAEAAEALARKNNCFRCHAVDKAKIGPAYKDVAARLKTKPDGAERIIKHITSGPIVKFPGGTEESHKIIDTQDPKALRNLAQWILSL